MPPSQQAYSNADRDGGQRTTPSPNGARNQAPEATSPAIVPPQQNQPRANISEWRTTESPEIVRHPFPPATGYASNRVVTGSSGDLARKIRQEPGRNEVYDNINDRPVQPRRAAETGDNKLLRIANIRWCHDKKRGSNKHTAGAIVGTLRLGYEIVDPDTEDEEAEGETIEDQAAADSEVVVWRVAIAVYPAAGDADLEVRLAIEVIQGQAIPYNLKQIRRIQDRIIGCRFQGQINNGFDFGIDILLDREQVELVDWVADIIEAKGDREAWIKELNRLFREEGDNGEFSFPTNVVWTGQGEHFFGRHC